MSSSAVCRYEQTDAGSRLRLSGVWRLSTLAELHDSLLGCLPRSGIGAPVVVDGSALEEIDTSGALALWQRLESAGAAPDEVELAGFGDAQRATLDLVRARLDEVIGSRAVGRLALDAPAVDPLRTVGEGAVSLWRLVVGNVEWLGRVVTALAQTVLLPQRLRPRELFAQLSQVCVAAIPVVALVSFLIGLVVAYLLGLQATQYGANIFVVDGVALGLAREFSPLIVAVILAGRSGSAFAAQLGTMNITEEIDAIRTLGLSVEQVLVVPRVLALVVAMPLLVFVGDVVGLLGAMTIADHMLDIGPGQFLERLRYALAPRHLVIGLVKAPVFAFAIALIGCRMGMTVSRDARSIGRNTTSTVVQAIVLVIVLDALFAVLLQALGL
ncbi:MAG: ABC transporter permease [Burkholderiaceae bacterium]|nr:ABC transporter permease [Burkholderiaceae bacterium]